MHSVVKYKRRPNINIVTVKKYAFKEMGLASPKKPKKSKKKYKKVEESNSYSYEIHFYL